MKVPADFPFFQPRRPLGRPSYTPPGLLCLADAIEIVGRRIFGGQWTGDEARARSLPPLPIGAPEAESRLLSRAGKRTRKDNLSDDLEYTVQPMPCDSYEEEQTASERWRQATLQLHNMLCSNRPPAIVITFHGNEVQIPNRIWKSNEAKRILVAGKAKFRPDHADILANPVEGHAFLSQSELESALPRESSGQRSATVAAETRCRVWLEDMMREGAKNKTKTQYQAEAKEKFGVGAKAFGRAWTNAIINTRNTDWSKPGPKPRK